MRAMICRLTSGRSSKTLVTPQQLQDLILEAPSSYFHFCLYAQVPIEDLLNLDVNAPLTIRNAHIANYDLFNGCFYEAACLGDVTVSPEDGQLHAIGGWYSPSKICDFDNTFYYGNIANVVISDETTDQAIEDEQHELPLAA